MPDAKIAGIVAHVENIGRNCEFGAIQNHYGVKPISLLRWAGSNRCDLACAIRERFSRLGQSATGIGNPPNRAATDQFWWLTDTAYKIIFHTGERPSETSVEEALAKTRRRWARLAEMQIESFRDATKLFLFSDKTLRSPDDARDLFNAIRDVGPAWLLVVIERPECAGHAMMIEPGFMIGYVDRLTNAGQANTFQIDYWPPMLEQAYALWKTFK
jgi:hypothetical protein